MKKSASGLKKWAGSHLSSTELLKALGLIGASFWLWLTGSIECTVGIFLLGWGLLELKEYLYWK
jgi:uncharacterized membrane protein YphA (DoxX/SURF4 family)